MMVLVNTYTSHVINELTQGGKLTSAIKNKILELRRDEKDFMLRLDPKYIEKFTAHYQTMSEQLAVNGRANPQLLAQYHDKFITLTEAYHVMGLGYYGADA